MRANTIISGYYISSNAEDQSKSIIRTISQTDLGGNIPVKSVTGFTSKAPKEWILKLKKGLENIRKNK